MDATIKAQWLAALRSGKYKQGKGALHNKTEDTYCCLGVLCEVMNVPKYAPNGDPYYGENGKTQFTHYGTEMEFTSCSLPDSVATAVGLSCYGCFGSGDDEDSLAHLNDTGYDFEAIADIIEEKF